MADMSDFDTGEQIPESDKDTRFSKAVKDTYENVSMLVRILKEISDDLNNSDIETDKWFPQIQKEATELLNRLKTHIPDDTTTDKIKSIKMCTYDYNIYEDTLETRRNNAWCENRYRTQLHTTSCNVERHTDCMLRYLLTNINWQREIERLIRRDSEIIKLLSDIYNYAL